MDKYEYDAVVVGVDALTDTLNGSSQNGWEVFEIIPSSYSSVNRPFTDLNQVVVVLRSKVEG